MGEKVRDVDKGRKEVVMNGALAVTIRSACERTVAWCVASLTQQLDDELIRVIEVSPFEAALECCFEIGIDANAEWLLTVDADVLPSRNLVAEASALAQHYPESVCMFSGRVHDKFFGAYRRAGIRIYRTAWLPKALDLIPHPGAKLRPEAYVVDSLVNLGAERRYNAWITGIHDYEQYYCDIFRKSYLHAKKHKEIFQLLPEWVRKGVEDTDFRVAVYGAMKGLLDKAPGAVDARLLQDEASLTLEHLGITEKGPAKSEDLAHLAEAVIAQYGPIPPDATRLAQWREQLEKLGVLTGARWIAGDVFEKLGRKLKRL